MLVGRFGDTSGRPYIEGRIFLPRSSAFADVSFIVDTGADRSLLMPIDGTRLALDYSALAGDESCIGVSGISRNFVEPAFVLFAEHSVCLSIYSIDLAIASPSPDIEDIPSLLGRDILDKWRMNYSPTDKLLTFDVLSFDSKIPTGPQG